MPGPAGEAPTQTNASLSKTRKDDKASIVIRVSYKGRLDLYTGYSVKPNQWSSARRRVKQGVKVDGVYYNIINDNIDEMERFCIDYINSTLSREEVPTVEELKRQFNYTFKQGKTETS